MNKFRLIINQECFWNRNKFIEFLLRNQGQPIEINTGPEGICLETAGIYKLLEIFDYKNVTILTANALESHPCYEIILFHFDHYFSTVGPVDPQFHCWDQSKIFGCFYNRPTWDRIGLASFLHVHHDSQSLINFRPSPYSIEQHNYFDLNKLLINSPQSINDFAKIMPKLPMIIDSDQNFKVGQSSCSYEEKLKGFYTQFFIEVVAETWTDGNSFGPTEKTSRPINFKKPFIVYGSQDYLCYLRQMGFQTFNDFWDETYDGYSGADRYQRIVKLLGNLALLATTELADMYHKMQPILDHNFELLHNKNFNTKIQKIID